jgi:predicted transcriptional regulator of viral defense system
LRNEDVIKIFRQKGGYARTVELIERRVHTSTFNNLLEQGLIEKVKPGLYRLAPEELSQDENFTHDYFDAAMAIPDGIFCLITALSYHGLTTRKPVIIDIAIPPTYRNIKLNTVSVRFYRFKEPYYSLDIELVKTGITTLKIYGKEKSVCDAVRLRHLIGEDVAMESLNAYMRLHQKDINKLLETARICKIKHIVEPVVKAMSGF